MENSQKTQHKGVVALGVTVAALVLAVLGLVMTYYFQADHAIDLQHQVTDLKASVAEKEKAIANATATKPATQVQYREIPELGVKYKLMEQAKDLTYFYSVFSTKQEQNIGRVSFSTAVMSAQRQDDLRNEYPCTSSAAPSGGITRYSNGDMIIAGAVFGKIGKKIGSYYYVYDHPQYACSVNGQTIHGLQASIDAVKAAYDSLEAI